MNWEKLQETFPKAYNLFYDYFFDEEIKMYNPQYSPPSDMALMSGYLYDFFDENNTIIQLWLRWGSWEYLVVYDDINEKLNSYGKEGFDFNSRKEAEQAAFEKAFEILERRLEDEL